MSIYREIVTKAVIGKGKKKDSQVYEVNVGQEVSKTLGCWIINHQFQPLYKDQKTFIKGSYDIHIWYAFDNDKQTGLYQMKQEYEEEIELKMKNDETIKEDNELKVFCLKYPTCVKMDLEDNIIKVSVEKEFALDVIGEAKLKVQVSRLVEDEWTLDEEIDSSINPNYLEKK